MVNFLKGVAGRIPGRSSGRESMGQVEVSRAALRGALRALRDM